jgi:peptidyl-prolyl cis-trans isomerase D
MKENDLKIWAEKNKIKLLETNWLTKKDFLDQFQNPQLAKKVFESPKKEFFAPFETSKGFVILEIIDKKPARSLEFAEAKEKVKQDYLNSKGKELCEQKAKALLEKLKSKTDLIKEVFEKEGFQTKEYRLTRMEIPQKFSSNIAQLIANTGSSKVIDNIVWDRGDLKIFVIKSIKEFNGTIEDAEIQQASSVLLNQKRDKWFKEWYQNLFKKSKIKTYTLFEKF